MSFATKVTGLPVKPISAEAIDRFLKGAEKRIRKERRKAKQVRNDETYVVKRLENISRLKIIKDEVAALRDQL